MEMPKVTSGKRTIAEVDRKGSENWTQIKSKIEYETIIDDTIIMNITMNIYEKSVRSHIIGDKIVDYREVRQYKIKQLSDIETHEYGTRDRSFIKIIKKGIRNDDNKRLLREFPFLINYALNKPELNQLPLFSRLFYHSGYSNLTDVFDIWIIGNDNLTFALIKTMIKSKSPVNIQTSKIVFTLSTIEKLDSYINDQHFSYDKHAGNQSIARTHRDFSLKYYSGTRELELSAEIPMSEIPIGLRQGITFSLNTDNIPQHELMLLDALFYHGNWVKETCYGFVRSKLPDLLVECIPLYRNLTKIIAQYFV